MSTFVSSLPINRVARVPLRGWTFGIFRLNQLELVRQSVRHWTVLFKGATQAFMGTLYVAWQWRHCNCWRKIHQLNSCSDVFFQWKTRKSFGRPASHCFRTINVVFLLLLSLFVCSVTRFHGVYPILPPYQKEVYTCASRAFSELAWHSMTHTIVRVSELHRVACPMKLLVESNSEIPIFLRKN